MNNEKTNARKNGVDYINTTEEDMRRLNREAKQEAGLYDLNVTTVRKDEYNLELGPKDDVEYEGKLYYFTHYLIKCPGNRIALDIYDDDEYVDVTYIMDYCEDIFVFMKKEDLSSSGFTEFVTDRLESYLITLNRTIKITADKNPEDYLAYRELKTLVNFINKYDEFIYGKRSYLYDSEFMLFHTTDTEYRKFNVAIVRNDGIEFCTDFTKVGLIKDGKSSTTDDVNKKEEPVKTNDHVISDKMRNTYFPEARYNKAASEITTCLKAFDVPMPKSQVALEVLLPKWKHTLLYMVNVFNAQIEGGCPIEDAWKSDFGKALLSQLSFIYENSNRILELTKEPVIFSVKVLDNYQLKLSFDNEE